MIHNKSRRNEGKKKHNRRFSKCHDSKKRYFPSLEATHRDFNATKWNHTSFAHWFLTFLFTPSTILFTHHFSIIKIHQNYAQIKYYFSYKYLFFYFKTIYSLLFTIIQIQNYFLRLKFLSHYLLVSHLQSSFSFFDVSFVFMFISSSFVFFFVIHDRVKNYYYKTLI